MFQVTMHLRNMSEVYVHHEGTNLTCPSGIKSHFLHDHTQVLLNEKKIEVTNKKFHESLTSQRDRMLLSETGTRQANCDTDTSF